MAFSDVVANFVELSPCSSLWCNTSVFLDELLSLVSTLLSRSGIALSLHFFQASKIFSNNPNETFWQIQARRWTSLKLWSPTRRIDSRGAGQDLKWGQECVRVHLTSTLTLLATSSKTAANPNHLQLSIVQFKKEIQTKKIKTNKT